MASGATALSPPFPTHRGSTRAAFTHADPSLASASVCRGLLCRATVRQRIPREHDRGANHNGRPVEHKQLGALWLPPATVAPWASRRSGRGAYGGAPVCRWCHHPSPNEGTGGAVGYDDGGRWLWGHEHPPPPPLSGATPYARAARVAHDGSRRRKRHRHRRHSCYGHPPDASAGGEPRATIQRGTQRSAAAAVGDATAIAAGCSLSSHRHRWRRTIPSSLAAQQAVPRPARPCLMTHRRRP